VSADSIVRKLKSEDKTSLNVRTLSMGKRKRIALVAHDNKKTDLLEWAKFNEELLRHHDLIATGATGRIIERELGIGVVKLQSGPLGGDQQIGSMIVDGEIDFLIFFWDPLESLPHDPDVKALLRMCMVWNIPVACNRASADFMISSPLMAEEYARILPNYDDYRKTRSEPVA
jgi:methylglyoxal synthase